MMTESTPIMLVGPSSDGRTNRWEITCPKCSHKFTPLTTRFSKQEVQCPGRKCGAYLLANYNAEPATCTIMRFLEND